MNIEKGKEYTFKGDSTELYTKGFVYKVLEHQRTIVQGQIYQVEADHRKTSFWNRLHFFRDFEEKEYKSMKSDEAFEVLERVANAGSERQRKDNRKAIDSLKEIIATTREEIVQESHYSLTMPVEKALQNIRSLIEYMAEISRIPPMENGSLKSNAHALSVLTKAIEEPKAVQGVAEIVQESHYSHRYMFSDCKRSLQGIEVLYGTKVIAVLGQDRKQSIRKILKDECDLMSDNKLFSMYQESWDITQLIADDMTDFISKQEESYANFLEDLISGGDYFRWDKGIWKVR